MKTINKLLISLAVFTTFLFFIPSESISSDLGNTVLTVVAFLFGIIAGFYIVVTTTDYNSIKSILASETAGLISLHQNVSIYDKQSADQLSILVDKYIRKTFDFEIIDYAKGSQEEFEGIKKFITELPIKNELSSVHQNIMSTMNNIIVARQQLTILGTKSLSIFQWAVLFVLAIFFITLLYGLRSGELLFDIITVVISSSLVLILLLIRELDMYIWNEETFSFTIFENVLKSIGQLPYYPAESIKNKRVHPGEKEYRIGTLVNDSKSLDREIEIVRQ